MLDAPDFLAALGTLVRNQAEVIVVGGVIETKEQAGRTKDKLVLQILRDTLRLRRETEG